VLGFLAIFVGGMAFIALYKRLVQPKPEVVQQFKAQQSGEPGLTDGEVLAALRRRGSVGGLLWRSGALVASGGEVWWEGRILHRVVSLTGASLLETGPVNWLDSIQMTSGWEFLDVQRDGSRFRLAVERDTVDFVRSRFTQVLDT